jgi:hypothetical protein
VVAQMGRVESDFNTEIDYMLETIVVFFSTFVGITMTIDYLLFKLYYLNVFLKRKPIDPSRSFCPKGHLLLNNQNNNQMIQSAGNCKGSSETIRQFSNLIYGLHRRCRSNGTIPKENQIPCQSRRNVVAFAQRATIQYKHFSAATLTGIQIETRTNFAKWLAGVIDGDGNFDIRSCPAQGAKTKKHILKAIRIKLHNRDIRILTRIQNEFHFGRIRTDKKKPYSMYIISTQAEMKLFMQQINGLIRIKVDSFKKACSFLDMDFIQSNYTLEPLDAYFSGLVDTDGSIVFNYPSNRIECNIEFKYNKYTQKLNFDYVIPYTKPYVLLRNKKNQVPGKIFKSIAFKFQTVNGMIPVYNYFMKNRLYSDFKFYRVSSIKKFIEIRSYAKYPKESVEFKIYSSFVLNWIQYQNPLWTKVPFIAKLVSTHVD